MPRKNLMSWDGVCWSKMFRGERYKVYPSTLKVPANFDDGYLAANEWWQNKEREIDDRTPVVRELSTDARQSRYSGTTNLAEIGAELEQELAEIQRRIALVKTEQPHKVKKVESFKGHSVHSIGSHLDKFYESIRGTMRPASYTEIHDYLESVTAAELSGRKFFARNLAVLGITRTTVDDHYAWLKGQDFVVSAKKKYRGFFRRFVTYLAEREIIAQPPNLKSKEHRFKKVRKEIREFDDVAGTIAQLPADFQLWALLCLNTGMTQADLGALHWSKTDEAEAYIDQKRWTITRYRVKIGDNNPQAPTVTYKLWPEVVAMLKPLAQKSGVVFLTSTGERMYERREHPVTGKLVKKDMFGTYWLRWDFINKKSVAGTKKNPNENPIPIPLGKFRSIGDSTLKRDFDPKRGLSFRALCEVYLANVPHGPEAENYGKEYFAKDTCPFFKALDFIRAELFPETKKKRAAS